MLLISPVLSEAPAAAPSPDTRGVAALDLRTGEQLWLAPRSKGVRTLYVGNGAVRGKARGREDPDGCWSAETGKPIAETRCPLERTFAQPEPWLPSSEADPYAGGPWAGPHYLKLPFHELSTPARAINARRSGNRILFQLEGPPEKRELLAADRETGELAWERYFQPGQVARGRDSQPIDWYLRDELLLVGTAKTVERLDVQTGETLWQVPHPKRGQGGIQVMRHGGALIVARGGDLQALDPATGAQRWQYDTGTSYLNPTPRHEGDRLFLGVMRPRDGSEPGPRGAIPMRRPPPVQGAFHVSQRAGKLFIDVVERRHARGELHWMQNPVPATDKTVRLVTTDRWGDEWVTPLTGAIGPDGVWLKRHGTLDHAALFAGRRQVAYIHQPGPWRTSPLEVLYTAWRPVHGWLLGILALLAGSLGLITDRWTRARRTRLASYPRARSAPAREQLNSRIRLLMPGAIRLAVVHVTFLVGAGVALWLVAVPTPGTLVAASALTALVGSSVRRWRGFTVWLQSLYDEEDEPPDVQALLATAPRSPFTTELPGGGGGLTLQPAEGGELSLKNEDGGLSEVEGDGGLSEVEDTT